MHFALAFVAILVVSWASTGAGKLTEEQIKEIKNDFLGLDTNEDGRITIEEFSAAIRATDLNPTEDGIKYMFNKVDADGDGKIDFNEYLTLMATDTDKEKDIQEVFQELDKDGNGFLDAKEIKRILTDMGEKFTDEEVDEMIRIADTNRDGLIDFKEFVTLMTSNEKV